MKEISFSYNNYIKSYHFFAFPLGILATDDSAYRNWLLGRFIGLTYGNVLQYDEAAYDDWEIINDKLYRTLAIDDFDELIKDTINTSQVFHLWGVNEKYIPQTPSYQEDDFIHDLLITGYDKLGNITIVNYGDDSLLTKKVVHINDLKNSFTPQTQGRRFNILFDKISPLPPENIICSLQHYVAPHNAFELQYYDTILNPKHEMVVGIHAVKEFINSLRQNFYRGSHLNGICLLNEQKTSIMSCLIYLNSLGLITADLCNEYKKIASSSKNIKLKYLKFLFSQDEAIINKIILDLEKMLCDEIDILNNILLNSTISK